MTRYVKVKVEAKRSRRGAARNVYMRRETLTDLEAVAAIAGVTSVSAAIAVAAREYVSRRIPKVTAPAANASARRGSARGAGTSASGRSARR